MNVRITIADISVEVDDYVETPTIDAIETVLARVASAALAVHATIYDITDTDKTETLTTPNNDNAKET